MKMKTMPIGIRLPVELVERVQNYRAGLELPGMEVTLTDAIRVLLEAGLRADRADALDSMPAKNPKKLLVHVSREIAVRSQTDPRTVQRLVMSRREVATALGLSVETIDRMRDREQIRSVVIGGSVRIPVTEIDRLVGQHD